MLIDIAALEIKKEELQTEYYTALERLYTTELVKVFQWFVEKFPQRKLKWVSEMGCEFFILDGDILHWDALTLMHSDDGWDMYYEDAVPDRKAKILRPMWDFFQMIHDVTNAPAELSFTPSMSTETYKNFI